MAASKSKNTGHSGRNTKKKTAMEQEVGRFQTEIILFVILAACVILMASNFGAGGFVGDAISFCVGQRSFSQTDICRVQLCWIIML